MVMAVWETEDPGPAGQAMAMGQTEWPRSTQLQPQRCGWETRGQGPGGSPALGSLAVEGRGPEGNSNRTHTVIEKGHSRALGGGAVAGS